MRPGAPGGGVGLANGVGEVLEARSGSRDHILEELEHFILLLPRRASPLDSPPDFWSSPIASPGGGWLVRRRRRGRSGEDDDEGGRGETGTRRG